jgi:hypothetical protein
MAHFLAVCYPWRRASDQRRSTLYSSGPPTQRQLCHVAFSRSWRPDIPRQRHLTPTNRRRSRIQPETPDKIAKLLQRPVRPYCAWWMKLPQDEFARIRVVRAPSLQCFLYPIAEPHVVVGCFSTPWSIARRSRAGGPVLVQWWCWSSAPVLQTCTRTFELMARAGARRFAVLECSDPTASPAPGLSC